MSAAVSTPKRFEPRIQAVDLGGRVPPHDVDTEAAIVGTILHSGARELERVLDLLNADCFYSDAHRRIFEAAAELHKVGTPVDFQTVAVWLKDRERLHSVGGVSYLNKLVGQTTDHLRAYATIVREKSEIRALIEECQRIAAEGYGDYGDAREFISASQARVRKCVSESRSEDAVEMRDIVLAEEARLDAIERGELAAGGFPTGFRDLDAVLGGLYDGETTIVAGRPGMGKTAFAGNLAVRVASEPWNSVRLAVLVLSIEAKRDQFVRRMAASEAGINSQRLRDGKLSPAERARLHAAHTFLAGLPIAIDDSPVVTPSKIRARVLRAQAKLAERRGEPIRLALVALDYVQRAKPDVREKGMTREREIAEVSTAFTETMKEAGVHGVMLAQLNRELEKRNGKDLRPKLSDLRESGQLEQDAHNVIALHRPAYYQDKDKVDAHARSRAEALVLKQREGQTGVVDLRFVDWCTKFADVPLDEVNAPPPSEPPKAYAPDSKLKKSNRKEP